MPKPQKPKKRSTAQAERISFQTSARTIEKIEILAELKNTTRREILEDMTENHWRMNRPLIRDWVP